MQARSCKKKKKAFCLLKYISRIFYVQTESRLRCLCLCQRVTLQHLRAAAKMSVTEWMMGSLPLISFNSIHGYFHLHLRAFDVHNNLINLEELNVLNISPNKAEVTGRKASGDI